jgi:uncharacterized SAM-binding protein YcdF (DUF218 family)
MLSTTFIGTKLITPLENAYTQPKTIPSDLDAVVVLSGGNNLGAPNLPLLAGAFKRTVYALMLAKKENLPLIFSGGFSESDAAKETLIQLDDMLDLNISTPKHYRKQFSLYFENKSLNTYENARFTKKLFASLGIDKPKILLVTSAYHMPRAMLLFEQSGFAALPAPTDYQASTLYHFAYLPSITGLSLSYFALHEYVGYLRYLLKN